MHHGMEAQKSNIVLVHEFFEADAIANAEAPESEKEDYRKDLIGDAEEPFAAKINERGDQLVAQFYSDLASGVEDMLNSMPVLGRYLMEKENAEAVAVRLLRRFI